MKTSVSIASLALLLLSGVPNAEARVGDPQRKLLLTPENPIEGQFLVTFGPGIDNVANAVSSLTSILPGVNVIHTYQYAIQGVALGGVTAGLLDILLLSDLVESVVQDNEVTISGQTQVSPPWGLDRIDQVDAPPFDNRYSYSCSGKGAWVYVLDTGINPTHKDFEDRAVCGPSFVNFESDCVDGNGHGTHCAGTVAGRTYGIAKEATIVGVKVLSSFGSGSSSTVAAGLDYVVQEKNENPDRNIVASLSLGGGASSFTDDATNGAVNQGVVVVVAAGNDDDNACDYSPARAAQAITVGATDRTDSRSTFSNFGNCVDIFAPGSDIQSSWYTSDTATRSLSGTSMAAPHVAGLAALYLQAGSTPNQMLQDAISNTISDVGSGSPNLMAYSGSLACDGNSNPAPTAAPVVSPTRAPIAPPAPTCKTSNESCGSNSECCSGSCECNGFLFLCFGRNCA